MPSYFFFQLKQVAGLIPAYLRGLIGVGGVGEGPGAPGAGPTGLGEPSPPGIGQDGAVGTRGTCCFAMSARTRSPCGERISGRPSRRSSLRTHRWSGRTPLRSRKARRTCPLHLGWRSPAPRGRGASTYRRGPPSRSHRLRRHRRRPFLGSGSTLIAADKTCRVCRGVELDPLYTRGSPQSGRSRASVKSMPQAGSATLLISWRSRPPARPAP
jgi:hypothetical protein